MRVQARLAQMLRGQTDLDLITNEIDKNEREIAEMKAEIKTLDDLIKVHEKAGEIRDKLGLSKRIM